MLYSVPLASLTTALEALAKGALVQQPQEVCPLKGGGAHDQHVRGHHVGQPLHPKDVPYHSQVAHSR